MGLLIILLLTCLSAAAERNPKFLITAPSEVHVGQNETITVQVFESSSDVWISVYFEEQITNATLSRVFSRKLSSENNFTQIVHMQILPKETLHLNLNEEQYVRIVAKMSSPLLVTKTALIRLKSRPYFIYIATDKPVYAPAETVHYQIFTLDQDLKPAKSSVAVEVLDANGSVLSAVDRPTVAQSVHIGEINIGLETHETYQIRARVTKNSEYYGLKKFQVRKYEFPKFDLRITPDYGYFMVNSDTFSLTIQVANKMDAALNANVTFGISLLSGRKVHLPELDQHLQVRNGSATVILRKAELLRSIQKVGKMDMFIGGTLYIAAEVSDGSKYLPPPSWYPHLSTWHLHLRAQRRKGPIAPCPR
ncbi:complement C5 [Leucoraja erinacea]|uniref:complement C5 n=1 Tax=Leucoraja erinaceus TaxID=7782 RepID=UPI0024579E6B|nr:complement C5 [Leucoraja erinacea]